MIELIKRVTYVGYSLFFVEGKGIRGVKNNNWQTFDKRMWQRNYWEHIIRYELSYLSISDYIKKNPTNRAKDIFV